MLVMVETLLKAVPMFGALIAGIWALVLFNKQQKFKRLQNLSALWRGFSQSDELLDLFNLMNEIESGHDTTTSLSTAHSKLKLKYLALIEEVALYVSLFEVDIDYARYLFQWHFHFVYGSSATTAAFWDNLGGAVEMNADYWSKSRSLAGRMTPKE